MLHDTYFESKARPAHHKSLGCLPEQDPRTWESRILRTALAYES